ncbi:MAG: Ig-like domain-containing protein [Myxococcaceae bacterium]
MTLRPYAAVLLLSALLFACGAKPGSGGSAGGGEGGAAGGGSGGSVGGGGGAGSGGPAFGALTPVTVNENETATITLSATDAENDPIDFSLLSPPSFATLSGATITLAPTYADSGSYTLNVRVSDGHTNTDGSIAITVVNVNRAPVLAAIADLTVASNGNQTVTLSATDPDGDPITYSLGSATPSWISLSGASIQLSAPASSAPVAVNVAASDGTLSDSKSFTVTVAQPLSGSISINSGSTYSKSSSVTLTLSASSIGGTVTQMRFSNDATTWTAWETYATSKASYALSANDGVKTVYVEFQDSNGLVAQFSDDITLDTTAPVATVDYSNGTHYVNQYYADLTITASESPVELAVTVQSSTLPAPTSPSAFSSFSSPYSAYLGAAEGPRMIYVWLRDQAGNVSAQVSYFLVVDTKSPGASAEAPVSGATGVVRDVKPLIRFSEQMDPSTITSANLSIAGVASTVRYFAGSNGWYAQLTPSAVLAANTSYTVTLTTASDLAGNALNGPLSYSFTTGSYGALSGTTAPLHKLSTATNPAGTMVLDEAYNGGGANELNAYFNDGTGWTQRTVSAGSNAQLVAYGSSFAVHWANPGYYAGSMATFSNGQWTTGLPEPVGTMIGSSSKLLSVAVAQNYPYAIYANFFDGTNWVASGGGVSDAVYQAPVAASNQAGGFAIVYGKLNGVGSYSVLVNRYDGTSWAATTIDSGGGFPSGFAVAGSGSSFLACGTSGGFACKLYDPATSAWTSKTPLGYASSIAGNGAGGYALGVLSATTANTAVVEVYDGQAWLTGNAVLTVPATANVKVAARSGGYVAVWQNALDLQAASFDGTSWSAVTTLATGTAADPVSLSDIKTVGSSTVITWNDSLNVYARTFIGSTFSATTKLNAAERAATPLVTSISGAAAVVSGESTSVLARAWRSTSSDFAPAATVGTGLLIGKADHPAEAFDGAGKGLTAWEQYDGGRASLFAAYFDGTSWGAPFRVTRNGSAPKVTFDSGTFLLAWASYNGTANSTAVTTATYTVAGGLGTPVILGTTAGQTELAVAARGGTFMAGWINSSGVVSSTSADGATWSTPIVVDSGARSQLALASSGVGFIINSQIYSGTAYTNTAHLWNGTAWTAPLTTSVTPCKVAGGTSAAAMLCGSSSFAAWVYTTTWSAQTSLGQWNGGNLALGSYGSGFTAIFGNQTRDWSAGSWTTTGSYSPAGATELAFNGTSLFAIGIVNDAASVPNLETYRAGGSGIVTNGRAENGAGSVSSAALAPTGTNFSVAWTQDELPFGIGGTGNRVLYARSY